MDRPIAEKTSSLREVGRGASDEADPHRRTDPPKIPPYQVSISSPLQRNFLYCLLVAGALGMGYAVPEWAPVLIYGAILVTFMIALLMTVRDGIFLHIEGQRLVYDGRMINKHALGPDGDKAEGPSGLLRGLRRKKRSVFRSRLMEIHYQNVLRTFEQGARRAWVYQDASISEIHTLLSQRGMKLVWTAIEVLPQLGLLGTLIGLVTMFMAFRADAVTPDLSIIAGLGTALGTTILANLFVLVLRPLYMQNERAMNEILSSLQTLMAIFILPTQQYAMDRGKARGGLAMAQNLMTQPSSSLASAQDPIVNGQLQHTLEDLAHKMRAFLEVQEQLNNKAPVLEAAQVAHEIQQVLHQFQESLDPFQLREQQQAMVALTEAVKDLAEQIGSPPNASDSDTAREQVEQDLAELRALTQDTLLMLEQIENRLPLGGATGGGLLSQQPSIQGPVLPDTVELDDQRSRQVRSTESTQSIQLARE